MNEKINAAVQRSIELFRLNPFEALSECDFQAILFCKIRDAAGPSPLRLPKNLGGFEIPMVRTEYRADYSNKVDIVCHSQADAEKVLSEQPESLSSRLWNLPISMAIELKVVPYFDQRMGSNVFLDDVMKLKALCAKDTAKSPNEPSPRWLQLTLFQNPETLRSFRKVVASSRVDTGSWNVTWETVYLIGSDGIYTVNNP